MCSQFLFLLYFPVFSSKTFQYLMCNYSHIHDQLLNLLSLLECLSDFLTGSNFFQFWRLKLSLLKSYIFLYFTLFVWQICCNAVSRDVVEGHTFAQLIYVNGTRGRTHPDRYSTVYQQSIFTLREIFRSQTLAKFLLGGISSRYNW